MPAFPDTLAVRVLARHPEAEAVVRLTLAAVDGAALPPFEPGAHIDLHLANGLVRQYSLLAAADAAEDDDAAGRYQIAVGLADLSRGGSSHIHAALAVGDVLTISRPRNNFPLAGDGAAYLFIAGGIGITPIAGMLHWCEEHGKPWRLLYTVRSRRRAACLAGLPGPDDERVLLHFDDEKDGHADVAAFLAGPRVQGSHIYCCGPEALITAVQEAAAGHPPEALHFERFSAPVLGEPHHPDHAFLLRLRRSGRELNVEAGVSILATLEGAGVALPFACREGLCRSCETAVHAGRPDHRDYVLSDEERERGATMMICVSRSLDAVLELDI